MDWAEKRKTARAVPLTELNKHNKKEDIWVVIHGYVYNLTSFVDEHPGGSNIILNQAGVDGTDEFNRYHSTDIIDRILPPSCLIGKVDETTSMPQRILSSDENSKLNQLINQKPPLSEMLNCSDFEAVACKIMKPHAFAYYSSAADDELTLRENRTSFQRIWFKPHVMVDVSNINTETEILGYECSLPIYITATALGKLGHPEGEVVLTKAAANENIIQMVPTLASCSLKEISNARVNGSPIQFFQLYVNSDRQKTTELIEEAERAGCKALFITVDAPVLGKREKDMRMKFTEAPPSVQKNDNLGRQEGAARAISGFISASLCWNDLEWFKKITKIPIVLKGVQRGDDAVKAAKYGCKGIVISNHGGRQLDCARSAIEILPEVMAALKQNNIPNTFEVYVDGGIRRGSDIVKAIALGAKAVGIGRPFLYAMSTYGQKGVERAIKILRDEVVMCMRLCGITSVKDLSGSDIITTKELQFHGKPPNDCVHESVYIPLEIPMAKL